MDLVVVRQFRAKHPLRGLVGVESLAPGSTDLGMALIGPNLQKLQTAKFVPLPVTFAVQQRYTHQLLCLALNCPNLRSVSNLGLRSTTANYPLLS
jgi:hypothetical protein